MMLAMFRLAVVPPLRSEAGYGPEKKAIGEEFGQISIVFDALSE